MNAQQLFGLGQQFGANYQSSRTKQADVSAIDEILSQANATGNPQDIDMAMSQILSKVSPDRQARALAILQNKQQQLLANQEQKKKEDLLTQGRNQKAQAYKNAGFDESYMDLDPRLQVEKFKAQNPTAKAPLGGISGQSVPPEVSQAIPNILESNKNSNADELAVAFDLARIPRAYSNSYIENRRRQDEANSKLIQDDKKDLKQDIRNAKQETIKLRQEIADKANSAREGIRNKNHLIDIINTGKIDDPTFATLSSILPYNLGKRMLSNETVEYKSGLVDEFKDLRNVFSGATRVKEIDLMEEKIADIYLTDEQKKAILKSRINALQLDIIREEAAAEVEEKFPELGALQFSRKVDEIARPKMNSLFDRVLDEQKTIIKQAEKRKETALNPNDPEDYSILKQILKEANGNKEEARKIAKKKGYKF
jgi:hypothetical protein